MSMGMKTTIYPVKDIEKAKTLFSSLLGVEPDMDKPYYVNFNVGGLDVGLHPNGHSLGMTGPVCYWNVADIRSSLEQLVSAGARPVQEPKDVGGGKLVATVRDADDNVIGLIQNP